MKSLRILAIAIAASFGVSTAAGGATLRVPSEYPTINSGLDAASPGDTVLVAPGTYPDFEIRTLVGQSSACAFLKAGVVLKSEQGSSATALDRQGVATSATDYTVVGWFADGAVIEGFRITGNPPEATAALVQGLPQSSPTVVFRDCVFENLTTNSTAALAAVIASVSLYECRFTDCHGGASTILQGEGHMIVEDCVFENCSETALRCEGNDFVVETLTVRNSIFRNNSSTLSGGAIIASYYDGGALIEGCLFEGNQAYLSGGAIDALVATSFTLRDNVFINNRVEGYTYATGGGMYLANGAGPLCVIERNTFYGCHQGYFDGGSAIYGNGGGPTLRDNVFVLSTGAPAVSLTSPPVDEGCNLFWNNLAGDAVGFTPDSTDVFADPEFCNATGGDCTVSSTSPCAPGNTPSCDQIGALGVGCGSVSIEPMSWGKLKARFRGSAEE